MNREQSTPAPLGAGTSATSTGGKWLYLEQPDREQLLLAVELALAIGREDPRVDMVFAHLDAARLESLGDRLFAKGSESLREAADARA